MDEPNTYTMELSRPIEAHGEQVSELTLRDPDSGALFQLDVTLGSGGLTINLGSISKVIASAAGIPPSSAKQILMRDVFANLQGIMDFFGVDTRVTGES